MGTGDYNLFSTGNKVLKNREGYDRTFGERTSILCINCGVSGADRFHYHSGNYYCTHCARRIGIQIEERHVP